MIILHLCYW